MIKLFEAVTVNGHGEESKVLINVLNIVMIDSDRYVYLVDGQEPLMLTVESYNRLLQLLDEVIVK